MRWRKSLSLARVKAKELIEDLHIDDPSLLVRLPEICMERGAFVREDHLEGSEARLTMEGNRGIITVRPVEEYATRTRFSIAHELGHFELHREGNGSLSCDQRDLNDRYATQGRKNREREANEFASDRLV